MQNNARTNIDVGLKREIRFVFHFDYLWGVMFAYTVCHVEEYKQQFMVSRTIVFSYYRIFFNVKKSQKKLKQLMYTCDIQSTHGY